MPYQEEKKVLYFLVGRLQTGNPVNFVLGKSSEWDVQRSELSKEYNSVAWTDPEEI